MNRASRDSIANSPGAAAALWLTVLAAALLSVCVSAEGFWVDEITTSVIAGQRSLSGAAGAVMRSGSELQMPAYAAWAWIWARVFGAGELALRLSNIPWMLAGLVSMSALFRRNGISPWAIILTLHPLLCFHMNEARPYIMTFGSAAAALNAVDALWSAAAAGKRPPRALALSGAAAGAVCIFSSMLNLFLIPALGAFALAIRARWREADAATAGARSLLVFSIMLSGLAGAAYFAWTIMLGHGGGRDGFGLARLGLAAYEWAGFRGLGPPWHELRRFQGIPALRDCGLPLAAGAAAWLAVLYAAVARAGKQFIPPLLALAAGLCSLGLAAFAAGASLSGRHFMFAMPLFLLTLGTVLFPATPARAGIALPARAALVSVFLLSSAAIRFSPQHRKENPFRETLAELAGRWSYYGARPIAWVAYASPLSVYGWSAPGDTGGRPAPNSAGMQPFETAAADWDKDMISAWVSEHPSFFAVIDRPDVCDRSGAWMRAISAAGGVKEWEMRGMTVYRVDHAR